jgi:hypothetical protein
MKSTNWRPPARLAFLLSAIWASGCATDLDHIRAAEEAKATDLVIAEAIALGAQQVELPKQPRRCYGPIRSGAMPEDRADAALLKQDAALTQANALLAACAKLYEELRKSKAGAE